MPLRNQDVDTSTRANDDARNNIGHYLCQFEYREPETVGSTTLPYRQPPEDRTTSLRLKSSCVSRQGIGLPILCPHGGDAPIRKEGVDVTGGSHEPVSWNLGRLPLNGEKFVSTPGIFISSVRAQNISAGLIPCNSETQDAIMQKTVNLGQVVQPTVLSKVERIVKNLSEKIDRKVSDSEFCQVLGISPWHLTLEGMKVAFAILLMIAMVCGIAEMLER